MLSRALHVLDHVFTGFRRPTMVHETFTSSSAAVGPPARSPLRKTPAPRDVRVAAEVRSAALVRSRCEAVRSVHYAKYHVAGFIGAGVG